MTAGTLPGFLRPAVKAAADMPRLVLTAEQVAAVAVLDHALPEDKRSGAVAGPGHAAVTFSDTVTAGRRWLGCERVLPQPGCVEGLENLPEPLRGAAGGSRTDRVGFNPPIPIGPPGPR